MAQTVIGIFDNEKEARKAIDHLVDRGFTRSNIDISDRSSASSSSGYNSASSSSGYNSASSTSDYSSTSGDYTTNRKHDDDDSIGGFFRSLFGSSDDSDRYTSVASRSCVVTVHAQSSDEAERAADILDEYGAVDVNERAAQYGNFSNTSNFSDTTTTGAALDTDRFRDRDVVDTDRMDRRDVTDSETSLPIIEEQLNVGKRVVETGGVRLRSRIIEKPVEESLRLREEHVRVERHAVNRPASEADITGFREGTIEMTEQAEVPIVNKEARVVEEVSLSKEVEEREETIRDTVRRTDVEVENLRRDETVRRDDMDSRRYDSDDNRLDSDDLNRPSGL